MDLAAYAHLAAGLHDTGSHQSAFGIDDPLVSLRHEAVRHLFDLSVYDTDVLHLFKNICTVDQHTVFYQHGCHLLNFPSGTGSYR